MAPPAPLLAGAAGPGGGGGGAAGAGPGRPVFSPRGHARGWRLGRGARQDAGPGRTRGFPKPLSSRRELVAD